MPQIRKSRRALDILSVALRVPSLRLTNADILDLILEYNSEQAKDEVEGYCREIGKLLSTAGAETRHVRNKDEGERGFDLTMEAISEALQKANIEPGDLDLIIFCGVGRGFIEPANAYFVAKALRVTCDSFDVLDACMSWVRALHVAYNFLNRGAYSTVLIVNAEFNVYERGLPELLALRTKQQLAYTFPSLTIGEATTATVVTASTARWNFRFRSAPEVASYCAIPLPGYEDFCEPDRHLDSRDPHQMLAFGPMLTYRASRAMLAFFRDAHNDLGPVDVWFPHMTAEPIFRGLAERLDLGGKIYSEVFRKFGNIVSASIPAGLVLAQSEGQLMRGNRIGFCPATAGMAYALVDGDY